MSLRILLMRHSWGRKKFTRTFSSQVHSYSEVKVDRLEGNDTGILEVGLNRFKGKNSFSRTFYRSIDEIFEAANRDDKLRAVIIRSHVPGVFCAGADLKERLTMSESEVHNFVRDLRNLLVKIENCPVPVIAALNGAALGGGLELALACDIRVASDKAMVGLVETKLAIIPGAGGTQRLSRLIGPSIAKELIFTSRILSGKEAKEYGLVNHCVSSSEEEDTAYIKALSIAREILPNGPIGVRMAKQAINLGMEVDISRGFAFEELCYSRVIPTKDRLEGLKAFLEKRTPVYSGK